MGLDDFEELLRLRESKKAKTEIRRESLKKVFGGNKLLMKYSEFLNKE